MKNLTILAICLVLLGCRSNTQTDVGKDTAAMDTLPLDGTSTDTIKTNPKSTNPSELKVFKGLYVSGNEVRTFRDCANSKAIYWLEDESKKLASSYRKTEGFLSYPYESIYVEIKGYLKGKSNMGYASEYENVLVVTDVISATQKSFSTECFEFEFIALGNEPFWSVEIIPSEKIIALKDVAAARTYVFPYKASKVLGNTISYESSNNQNQTIEVLIINKPCSDGMSDRKYNYSALVQINDKTFKGCAIKKGDKFDIQP